MAAFSVAVFAAALALAVLAFLACSLASCSFLGADTRSALASFRATVNSDMSAVATAFAISSGEAADAVNVEIVVVKRISKVINVGIFIFIYYTVTTLEASALYLLVVLSTSCIGFIFVVTCF